MRRPLNPEGRFPNPPHWRDPWRVEVVYVQREGRAVIASLRISIESPISGDEGEDTDNPSVVKAMRDGLPPEGLTSANLRSLKLSSLRRADETSLRALVVEHGLRDYLDIRPKRRRARSMQQGRAFDDDFYAQLSIDYLDAVRTHPKRPLVALLKKYRLGDADLSEEDQRKLLRDRLALARRHEWLTGSGKGRVGGEPGPRLIEWRKQQAKRTRSQRKGR